jgi:hypothetical protein
MAKLRVTTRTSAGLDLGANYPGCPSIVSPLFMHYHVLLCLLSGFGPCVPNMFHWVGDGWEFSKGDQFLGFREENDGEGCSNTGVHYSIGIF